MSRILARPLQYALVAFVLLNTVACDQVSKSWARESLSGASVQLAEGRVELVLAENHGAFLSLGAHLNPRLRMALFTGGAGLALAAVIVWLFVREHSVARAVSFSLIVGGGLGNLADRVFRLGAVTDFIVVRQGQWHTGIFNFADIFITVGVMAVLVESAFVQKHAGAVPADEE